MVDVFMHGEYETLWLFLFIFHQLHGMSNGAEVSTQPSSQITNEVPISEVVNESSGSGISRKSSGAAFNMVRRICSAKLSFNI